MCFAIMEDTYIISKKQLRLIRTIKLKGAQMYVNNRSNKGFYDLSNKWGLYKNYQNIIIEIILGK